MTPSQSQVRISELQALAGNSAITLVPRVSGNGLHPKTYTHARKTDQNLSKNMLHSAFPLQKCSLQCDFTPVSDVSDETPMHLHLPMGDFLQCGAPI